MSTTPPDSGGKWFSAEWPAMAASVGEPQPPPPAPWGAAIGTGTSDRSGTKSAKSGNRRRTQETGSRRRGRIALRGQSRRLSDQDGRELARESPLSPLSFLPSSFVPFCLFVLPSLPASSSFPPPNLTPLTLSIFPTSCITSRRLSEVRKPLLASMHLRFLATHRWIRRLSLQRRLRTPRDVSHRKERQSWR